MDLPHENTSRHFGLTACAAGFLLVVFGFGGNFISIGFLLIAVAASIFSFAKRESKQGRGFAVAGVALALIVIVLHVVLKWDGFIGTLLRPYEQF